MDRLISGATALARQLRQLSANYRAVQDDAAVESMRRILVTFWIFAPTEVALAAWYRFYAVPAGQPDVKIWADSLFLLHTVTAMLTLGLLVAVTQYLKRPRIATGSATLLQILMCFTYLMYGVAVSYFDLAMGGVEAFILICCGIAGVSLMRPGISAAIFGSSYIVIHQVLSLAASPGAQRAIMQLNALIASLLSIALSAIIYHQYARGLLLRRELEVIAGHDALTMLPNRREITGRLGRALSAHTRSKSHGALLFIDLDHFKNINDTRGHTIGDQLLKEVAGRLLANVREADTVARLGGDEFVILMEDLGPDPQSAARQASVVANKILQALDQTYIVAGYEHRSTVSIGVSLFSGDQRTVDDLMKQADLAMYHAKYAGRNTVRFFDRDMQENMLMRATLEHELRAALVRNEFRLYFQPQVDDQGRPIGVEALIRWNHPQRGVLTPAHFIPVAEEVGLIVPIGHWVMREAFRQIMSWTTLTGLQELTVSINVSAVQFRQSDFVELIAGVLAETGANPRCIKLELTESMLVSNVEEVILKMNALSALGLKMSLDDFGTGYSSLMYLKRLPLSQLKIDQSFVRDVLTDPNDAAIAAVIVNLARTLELHAMAEGVETQEQRDFLLKAGCRHFQGYLFGKPMPPDELQALVTHRRGHSTQAL